MLGIELKLLWEEEGSEDKDFWDLFDLGEDDFLCILEGFLEG